MLAFVLALLLLAACFYVESVYALIVASTQIHLIAAFASRPSLYTAWQSSSTQIPSCTNANQPQEHAR